MEKKEDTSNKKIKTLLLDLANKDESKQVESIKALKMHGDQSVIRPLVEVMNQSDSELVKAEITDLLNTIKSTKVPAQIADCLKDPSLRSSHQILLSSIWNSGLDYRPFLKEIVAATLEGGLLEAIECITIIENQEGVFTEEQLFEPIILLKEYLVANKDVSDSRMDILKEIVVLLQEINNQL